jgi:hypothetical protein
LEFAHANASRRQQRGWNGQLLVPSLQFNRFQGEIAPAHAAERLIVV